MIVLIKSNPIIILVLQIILLAGSCITFYAQDEEHYTIIGKVVDEKGTPVSGANVLIEPVTDTSTAFDRFIINKITDTEGKFSIIKSKTPHKISNELFLYPWVDENLQALTTIKPPFDWLRKYDATFNGEFIKLGSENLIDVGNVKVKFWYGQVNLNFSNLETKKNLKDIDWTSVWVKIRNKDGFTVFKNSLSISNIKKYLSAEKSELKISLPVGKWKVELLSFSTAKKPSKKIAESNYFEIKKGEKPKNVIMKSTR